MPDCPVLIAVRSRRRLGNRTRLSGSTTFTGNRAYENGAAIYNSIREEDPVVTTTTYPSDTVFEDNDADVSRKLSLPIPIVDVTNRHSCRFH